MKPFLEKLAELIVKRYPDDPGQVCVVLPNRRAGLFLKKYLADQFPGPFWAPVTYSVEDFIIQHSGLQPAEPAGLLFELYEVHCAVSGDQKQDFDAFSNWGQVLLKDFNEIDLYLADPGKIFSYLNEAKALAIWNLGERELTDFETSYLRFYNSLSGFYLGLKDRLLAGGLAYQGLASRIVAENISEISGRFPWKKIIFAGLNAMSTAEEKIIGYLLESGKAEIFWDADSYYIDNPIQESGHFIREYMRKWPAIPAQWIENDLATSEKKIVITGVPRNIGQARYAGQILKELQPLTDHPEKTAIVLADETLLLPLLHSLPEEQEAFNITMGYPLKYTPLYSFFKSLFRLHENKERFKAGREGTIAAFYVHDILKILSDPYLSIFEEKNGDVSFHLNVVTSKMRESKKVFFTNDDMLSILQESPVRLKEITEIIFGNWESPDQALSAAINVIEVIRDKMILRQQARSDDHRFDLEYLFQFNRMLLKIKTIIDRFSSINTIRSLRKAVFQVIDSARLPFYGEPLKGIQVMGVLETRAIDFQNLIVLSMNEGVLPSGRVQNSFIPYDVRKDFHLPTHHEKDAVFAYHFYRMLQKAGNIQLMYDTEGDDLGGGEKSRFITQLALEMPKTNPRISITWQILNTAPVEIKNDITISIEKTTAVMEKLTERIKTGISPSSLNVYINCPLQFYFKEIAGLAETEEVEETIEPRTLGNVVHDTLYNVYLPFKGKFVDPATLKDYLEDSVKYILESFHKHYKEGDLYHGKNHLIFEVAKMMVHQAIQTEIEILEEQERPGQCLQIIDLEKNLETEIEIKSGDKIFNIKLKGKADRIDILNGTTRIIDYKTGTINNKDLKAGDWEELVSDPAKSKAFQLILYAYLYYRNVNGTISLETGNITLRSSSKYFMKASLPGEIPFNEESFDMIGKLVNDLLSQILDPGKDFLQAEELKNCKYCPYQAICNRLN